MSHYAGGTAAAVSKVHNYSSIPPDYIFQPIAFKTHRSLNSSGLDFLHEVGHRLTVFFGDLCETFLISTKILFPLMNIWTSSHLWYLILGVVFNPRDLYYPESKNSNNKYLADWLQQVLANSQNVALRQAELRNAIAQ